MSNHQEIPEDIRKQIKDFEHKLGNLKQFKGSARDDAVTKHQKHIKRIRRLMDTYQCSIQSGAFQGKTSTHKAQYKEFEAELARLEKGLESNRVQAETEEDLFKYKPKSTQKLDVNNRQMVVEAGDRAQAEGEQALKRIQRNIGHMDEQADLVMVQMDRQIQQLDKVYDELSDTETTLKRAQQHLRYFARQVYADRCLIFIIIVIALAILVIIGLAIAGKTPKQLNNKVQ